MIRIALVDDQAIVRAGLARILSPEDGFTIVAECSDGRQAVEELPALHPDVVLMDVRMPALDGVTATEELRSLDEPLDVLVLTTFGEDEVLWGAIEAGAAGFVLKDSSAEDLIAAVRAVAEGGAWFDPGVAPRLLERYRRVVGPGARDAVGRAHRPRARGPAAHGAWRLERRDRRDAARRGGDRQNTRREHLHQARRAGSCGRDRVRVRPRCRHARSRRAVAIASTPGGNAIRA
jgi:DNA-binding NarL/FixJ family response regulator